MSRETYALINESFPHLFKIYSEKGYIPEDHYELLGVRRDHDIDGNDVLREATITQEHLQRGKCLTHEYIVQQRKEHTESVQAKVRQNKIAENLRYQVKIDNSNAVVDVIIKKMQEAGLIQEDESGKEHLVHCTMKIFATLTNKQLSAFILARDRNFTADSQLPIKGKLAEAEANIDSSQRNRIRVAFDCRTEPSYLEENMPHDIADVVDEDDEEISLRVHHINLSHNESIWPSALLSNSSWVKYVIELFDIDKVVDVRTEISAGDKSKADLLLKIFRERYKTHVNTRVANTTKRKHWSLDLAYKNLSVVAAIMILSNHLKMDIDCLCDTDCLLATHASTFIPCQDVTSVNRQGAYLYFNTNKGFIVRSGKVVRRGFMKRHEEHLTCSKAENPDSNFYLMYPSRESVRSNLRGKQGFFEHLTPMVAAGFDPDSEAALCMEKDHTQGGLLIMSDDDRNHIESALKTKKLSTLQKCQEYIAYLLELGYDLAICPEHNVSRSPGFESFLGVYGGRN